MIKSELCCFTFEYLLDVRCMVCNKHYNAFHPAKRRLDCAGPIKPCSDEEPYCSHSFEKGLNFTGIVKKYAVNNKTVVEENISIILLLTNLSKLIFYRK